MIVYPAIDLMDGACVRLSQGRFDEATHYPACPAETLRQFERDGAEWAHIVDLDGARAGSPRQHAAIADLTSLTTLKLQVAGGIRHAEEVALLLRKDVARVVIGSMAVTHPEHVDVLLERFGPDRITLAFDVRLTGAAAVVAISGWTSSSDLTLWDAAARFPQARHILVTDIGRDGMMRGPNLGLSEELAKHLPQAAVQASGGVSSLSDLRALAAAGAAGAVVGKALWERKFTLPEALSVARA